MRSTYNIKDARDDLKLLNEFLVELGSDIRDTKADPNKLEELMSDPEFSRLMANIHFFQVEGNKYLADIYASKAGMYKERAEK